MPFVLLTAVSLGHFHLLTFRLQKGEMNPALLKSIAQMVAQLLAVIPKDFFVVVLEIIYTTVFPRVWLLESKLTRSSLLFVLDTLPMAGLFQISLQLQLNKVSNGGDVACVADRCRKVSDCLVLGNPALAIQRRV